MTKEEQIQEIQYDYNNLVSEYAFIWFEDLGGLVTNEFCTTQ